MKRFILLSLLLASPLLAQNKIATRPVGQQVVSFSATPTFDAGISSTFKMTLTANVTSSTVVGMESGQELTFEICQDGTGGRTFAWPALMVGPIAILAGANVCTVETFHYDGTSAYIWTTTTAGGGGSGTVNSGTGGHLAYYGATGTTISANANTDDGITNANGLTYAGSAGFYGTQFNSTASGSWIAVGTEGTPSGCAAGKDVLALGDLTSHSAQICNNGVGFFPVTQHDSTSPPPFGVVMATTFPQVHTSAAGTVGQPFISGGGSAFGGYSALDLSGGANNVVNRLPKLNLPTTTVFNDQVNTAAAAFTLDASAATTASGLRVPNIAGVAPTGNGAIAYDTTSNNFHAGVNGADAKLAAFTITPIDTRCAQWTVVSGHYELGQASGICGTPGGSVALSGLTAATTGNSTNSGDFAQTFNASLTTSSKHWWTISENVASTATGTPYLFDVHSIATSTANPFIVTALGTTNGWNLLNSGALWAPVGTGAIAIPGSAKGIVISQGGSSAATTVTGTNGQLVSFDASNNPIAADPIISFNYTNLQSASTATGTLTSSATRVSTFSQYGTLYVTWASITGSPSGCTIQIKSGDSLGNFLSNGSAISVSPANGTTSQLFTPAAGLLTAAQMQSVFACSVYPSTGTLSLEFVASSNPAPAVTQPVSLVAGSAIAGKVGIDQTTPGTTNAVAATNLPTTVDVNSGNKSASTLRVVLATDQPALTNKLLVTPDANVKVNMVGNGGASVDQAPGSAVPANVMMEGLSDGTNSRRALSDTTGRQFVMPYADTTTTSYHASKNVASAASATDISVLPGNATNTVLVNRVIVSCTQTTAGIVTIQLIKRSTADTAGTSSSMTAVPDDANYAAGVSAPLVYTANPTTGTAIGNVDTASVGCMAAATASANDIYIFKPTKPIVLRGTAQQLAVNLNSVTVTGGSFNVTYEYSETTTP